MLKLSIIFLISAIVLLLLYLLLGKGRKKSVNTGKKKSSGFKKFIGFLTFCAFIGSAVFFIIFSKEKNIFHRLKTYELPGQYSAALEADSAESAYSLLPVSMCSYNDNIYFVNTSKDAFIYSAADNNTAGFKTIANGTEYIAGRKTLKATITSDSKLILDGYFRYSKYDEKNLSYSNEVIASNVAKCSLTNNSLVYITNDGKLYAMGFNEYGQLCDTTTKNKQSPVFIMQNVVSADISDTHCMIIDKYGTLYAAGDNSYSQLGNKNAISSTQLVKVMQGVKDIKVGNYFSLVLGVNGELYTAGINTLGQLGNNGELFKAQLVPILTGIDKICVNGNTCAALSYSGQLYVWGDNANFKAATSSQNILVKPQMIYENVYDFCLSSKSVAVLTKDRDILISDSTGTLLPVLAFSATIPEQYKERTNSGTAETFEKV